MKHYLESNALSFALLEEELKISLHLKQVAPIRLHSGQLPLDIQKNHKAILGSGMHLYTDFTFRNGADVTCPIRLDDSRNYSIVAEFIKYKLELFFSTQDVLIQRDFTNDVVVWVPNHQVVSEQVTHYHRYGVKVRYGKISRGYEFLINYFGESQISKQPLTSSTTCNAALSSLLLVGNRVAKKNYAQTLPGYRASKAFPVISKKLGKSLGLPVTYKHIQNQYLNKQHHIHLFKKKFIDTPGFKTVFNPADQFTLFDSFKINQSDKQLHELVFAEGDLYHNPYKGMVESGPFKAPDATNLKVFFILPKDMDRALAIKMYYHIQLGKDGPDTPVRYKTLPEILDHPVEYLPKNQHLKYRSLDTVVDELNDYLAGFSFEENTKYLAIYVTTQDKNHIDPEYAHVYNKVKEVLLFAGRPIVSQCLSLRTIQSPSFRYALPNFETAINAKLGGVPWILGNNKAVNELIIGIGSHYCQIRKDVVFGTTIAFDNQGKFHNNRMYHAENKSKLAAVLSDSIIAYSDQFPELTRIVIHYDRPMSGTRLDEIDSMLSKLKSKIPLFVVSINVNGADTYCAFDQKADNRMPMSGTQVKIGRNEYQLFVNQRYTEESSGYAKKYPLPLTLRFICSDRNLLTPEVIGELSDQIYQFSNMHWKSINQQAIPVTISFPRMMVEIASKFDNLNLPYSTQSLLWYL